MEGKCNEERNFNYKRKSTPIFIFLCEEEANWRRTCVGIGLDTTRKWTNETLEEFFKTFDGKIDFDVNIYTNHGVVCKLQKVLVGHVFEEIIEVLVEFGYDVNEVDIHGRTALHYSVKYELNESRTKLIASGAAINAEARVSSWISLKLPTLFHCLYYLDLTATRLVLEASSTIPRVSCLGDFMFIPSKVPEEVKQCLLGIQEINVLTFMLVVCIIKSYGDPSLGADKLEKLLRQAASFRTLFEEKQCAQYPPPDCVLFFYLDSVASQHKNGFCKGKFFFQLVQILFRFR